MTFPSPSESDESQGREGESFPDFYILSVGIRRHLPVRSLLMRACCAGVVGLSTARPGSEPRHPGVSPRTLARRSQTGSRPKARGLRRVHVAALGDVVVGSLPAPLFSVAAVMSQTAGMPTETVGVLAAAATPALGAVGLFIWSKLWVGDAFTLNLVKCSVGTLGFVIAGFAGSGTQLLASCSSSVVAWLVLSGFIGIVIGDNLWLHALATLGPRRVILIDIIKPFIALAMARVALHEGVSVAVVLGMLLTLFGVSLVSLEERVEQNKENSSSGSVGTGDENTGSDSVGTGDAIDDIGAVDVESEYARVGAETTASKNKSTTSFVSTGYVAASLNVLFDTWGTVLTKQHGVGLSSWEINLVRFGSAAVALLVGAVARDGWRRRRRNALTDCTATATTDAGGSGKDGVLGIPTLPPKAWVQILCGIVFTTFLAPGLVSISQYPHSPD